MDDNLSNVLADLESPAGNEPSEATTEETTVSEEEAKTEEGEGTADEGEADHSEDDEEQDEDEQPKRKKRPGSERLRRQNEALKAELEQLRSRLPVQAGSENIEAAVQAEIGDPPKESEYPDFLSYERAMIAYEADKRLVTREVKKQFASQAATAQARQAEAVRTYNERLAEADKGTPGLAATIAKADVQIRNDVVQLIIESDKGPLLAHYLATHPQKTAELNGLSPVAAAKEIGRLEARISAAKPNTATKAPPPVTPIKGAATPSNPERELDNWLKQKYGR